MSKTMGYQGLLYYGTKGSTAAILIVDRVDANFDLSVETGSTTAAGDGTAVPFNTGEATALTGKVTFNIIVGSTGANDTAIVALQAAAATGNPIALRFIRSTGKTGFDADCVISTKQGAPLKGEQTMDVAVEMLSRSLRPPVLNG